MTNTLVNEDGELQISARLVEAADLAWYWAQQNPQGRTRIHGVTRESDGATYYVIRKEALEFFTGIDLNAEKGFPRAPTTFLETLRDIFGWKR